MKQSPSVPTGTYEQLVELDQNHVWHPFTQMKQYNEEPSLIIERGEGIMLYDLQGRSYYDGFSSVWLNVHGHNVPELNAAIAAQMGRVAHSTLLGMANVPSIQLAAELAHISPAGLTKVFYSDSGSTGVEIGLKMAYQYWRNRGIAGKTSFVTMREAYHGDTIGAVSVGAIPLYHEVFRPLLFPSFTVPYPNSYHHEGGAEGALAETLAQLEQTLKEHASEIAALIVEPLVQGASGIILMPPGCLTAIAKLCRAYDVLLIADEVATGFGRTGRMFACDHEGVSPDIMVVGKGLTGGYLPVAATLATHEVYNAFYADYEEQKTFFHGHSFTGNPLGCAVALESLRLMRERRIVESVEEKGQLVADRLAPLLDRPHVGEIRQQGLMIGIELVADKQSKTAYHWNERIGMLVCRRARDLGMLTRPLGNVVVFIPPLVSTNEELEAMCGILIQAIIDVTEGGWRP
ncbi:adenosylmethionine-8-amino-7-oxononanoate aminotransferase [Paenibacillus curdlanolyticus YK9]|uniref:Adenosylmethionine-8-amino-7-oxononanoate aminotransferase n=1 Tax=Paenibacillus curdlanolyticus YK9 TaxID=717606 RepID=E0I6S3_9BACL|nr:adenosylmethionine--8-amino-7-oxononanoate transaminase [Paenibacillus curdlanolyticus]EFM11739.1 adenosylmethionine-8-amino-7-oxononanoate aminotransferase [Paenibacillus curdlanolyticus YK9]